MSSPMVTDQAVNSWPRVMGTASCNWVRPILITSQNSPPFNANALRKWSMASISSRSSRMMAILRADGYTSLVDWDMFTVVERVEEFILPLGAPHDLQGAVADDLVGVHVRRGARPALDDVHHELVVQPAGEHVLAGAGDVPGLGLVQQAEGAVGLGRGQLDVGQRVDQARVLGQGNARDVEVVHGPAGLDAVVGVRRDPGLAQAVVFGAVFGH